MKKRVFGIWCLFAWFMSCGVALNQAGASVIAVSNFTDDGSYGLTSITVNGTTYSDLTGATASVVQSGIVSSTNLLGIWIKGTSPDLSVSDINSAASGLSYREGAVNVLTGSVFQFGKTIQSTDRIFLWDVGTGDSVSFQLIDSSDAVIGDYSISLTAANFGASNLTNFPLSPGVRTVAADGTVSDLSSITGERAVSFQLSDFTGTTGNLSLATGIRVSAGTGYDPSVVGLAAVPEPSTYLMLGLGIGLLLVLRKKCKPYPGERSIGI